MEIESEKGSKITLEKGQTIELGRTDIFSKDKKVSRKQISMFLEQNEKPSIEFEVVGKNPIWVFKKDKDEIMRFKRQEKGELVDGDKFCFYGKKPVWFNVGECGYVVDLETELERIDVSALDPVKEFGSIVMGHEFDHYPKHKIRPAKTWDWFLEEPKKESDDDESYDRKRSKGTRRKRKKGDGNDDDDEWTGESEEDDKELISKSRKVQRPKYSTRSKDRDKSAKFNERNKNSTTKKTISRGEEDDEEEDDDDDTLGGFIVNDDEVKEEEEDDDDETELDEEEEEEDLDEDDD